jgi:hypothetical protein
MMRFWRFTNDGRQSIDRKKTDQDGISSTATDKFDHPWYSLPGVVYFIAARSECEKCRSVKTGVTTRESLMRGLGAIQSSHHTKVRLLRIIEMEKDAGCGAEGRVEIRRSQIHIMLLSYLLSAFCFASGAQTTSKPLIDGNASRAALPPISVGA